MFRLPPIEPSPNDNTLFFGEFITIEEPKKPSPVQELPLNGIEKFILIWLLRSHWIHLDIAKEHEGLASIQAIPVNKSHSILAAEREREMARQGEEWSARPDLTVEEFAFLEHKVTGPDSIRQTCYRALGRLEEFKLIAISKRGDKRLALTDAGFHLVYNYVNTRPDYNKIATVLLRATKCNMGVIYCHEQ